MMRMILAMTLLLPVAGCLSVDAEAICDGTRADRTDHAEALAEDGGDKSVVTGARLLKKLDAGCGR
ncbi:hypothetical protein [Roseovarius amoyensis]|uniref:hypothetical protein n=1 Tax=Roseovarius amoyensis TaxID=2211448 RepID=UPI0013A6C235|nr:hypothetical protein [Roseovarius amoyensis]